MNSEGDKGIFTAATSAFTDAPAAPPGGEAGASDLARLRRSVTLNTEIIGALRTARDRLTQQNAELATLLAQYSTQLQFHTSEFLELHALLKSVRSSTSSASSPSMPTSASAYSAMPRASCACSMCC